ncbi:MAG: HAMP domain-containing protein [Azospirillum sp.]|nr:HAMP domain-containing protein [Azospirillum sp.]
MMAMSDRLQVSIRTGLAIGVVASALLTAALIHIPWSITAHDNVAELTSRLNGEIIAGLGERVGDLLRGAVVTQRAIAANLAAGVVDLADEARRRTFFLSFLNGQTALSGIEFIWPDDRAFATRRMDDQALEIETVTAATEAAQVRRRTDRFAIDQGGELRVTASRVVEDDQFPTRQYWYQLADATPTWSNIYPMAGSGRLGVTAAGTVTVTDGQTGVLAVSLELERISAFLDGIEVSPHGTVFLTNIYEELVAAKRGTGAALAGPNGRRRIGRLADAEAPLVRVAVRALGANGVALRDLAAPRQLSYADPERGETFFVTLAPLAEMGLIVALVVPQHDILGRIEANTRFLTYAVAGFLALTVVVAVWLAHRMLAQPLLRVTADARQLGAFDFREIRPTPSWLAEIGTLSQTISQMSASLTSFGKYVPTEVVRQLFAQGIEARLGGDQRRLTILFMDLANFTSISEALGEDLIPFLGLYLSEMSTVIRCGEGTIDKYIGDAIMAFWGAPVATGQHALLGCRAALACQRRLAEIRRERDHLGGPPLRARIGINTGRVLVGNVGSRERLNYTAIGDPVNVASRLESLNKLYGTAILIGEETRAELGDAVVARRLDRVAVYGKAQGVAVFELVALAEDADDDARRWVARFDQAGDALAARDWDGAEALFAEVIALRGGDDPPSALQIERVRRWRAAPPPVDWNGLVVLDQK